MSQEIFEAVVQNKPEELKDYLRRIGDADQSKVKEALAAFNEEGFSPLHEAIKKGHAACVTVLLDWGADVYQYSRCGKSCLYLTFEFERLAIAQQLVKFDEAKGKFSLLGQLAIYNNELNITHLHAACHTTSMSSDNLHAFLGAVSEASLRKAALLQTIDGCTPIYYAAFYHQSIGFCELVEKVDADSVSAAIVIQDSYREVTPLHLAAKNQNARGFCALLNKASVASVQQALFLESTDGSSAFADVMKFQDDESKRALIAKVGVEFIINNCDNDMLYEIIPLLFERIIDAAERGLTLSDPILGFIKRNLIDFDRLVGSNQRAFRVAFHSLQLSSCGFTFSFVRCVKYLQSADFIGLISLFDVGFARDVVMNKKSLDTFSWQLAMDHQPREVVQALVNKVGVDCMLAHYSHTSTFKFTRLKQYVFKSIIDDVDRGRKVSKEAIKFLKKYKALFEAQIVSDLKSLEVVLSSEQLLQIFPKSKQKRRLELRRQQQALKALCTNESLTVDKVKRCVKALREQLDQNRSHQRPFFKRDYPDVYRQLIEFNSRLISRRELIDADHPDEITGDEIRTLHVILKDYRANSSKVYSGYRQLFDEAIEALYLTETLKSLRANKQAPLLVLTEEEALKELAKIIKVLKKCEPMLSEGNIADAHLVCRFIMHLAKHTERAVGFYQENYPHLYFMPEDEGQKIPLHTTQVSVKKHGDDLQGDPNEFRDFILKFIRDFIAAFHIASSAAKTLDFFKKLEGGHCLEGRTTDLFEWITLIEKPPSIHEIFEKAIAECRAYNAVMLDASEEGLSKVSSVTEFIALRYLNTEYVEFEEGELTLKVLDEGAIVGYVRDVLCYEDDAEALDLH